MVHSYLPVLPLSTSFISGTILPTFPIYTIILFSPYNISKVGDFSFFYHRWEDQSSQSLSDLPSSLQGFSDSVPYPSYFKLSVSLSSVIFLLVTPLGRPILPIPEMQVSESNCYSAEFAFVLCFTSKVNQKKKTVKQYSFWYSSQMISRYQFYIGFNIL